MDDICSKCGHYFRDHDDWGCTQSGCICRWDDDEPFAIETTP